MDLQPSLVSHGTRDGSYFEMLVEDLDDMGFDDLLQEDISVSSCSPSSVWSSSSPPHVSASSSSASLAPPPPAPSSNSSGPGLVFLPSLSAPLIAIKDLLFPSERIPPSPPPYVLDEEKRRNAAAFTAAAIKEEADPSSSAAYPYCGTALPPQQFPLAFAPSYVDYKKRRLDDVEASPSFSLPVSAEALGRDKETFPLQSLSTASTPEDMLRMLNQSFVRTASASSDAIRRREMRRQQRGTGSATSMSPPPAPAAQSPSSAALDADDRRNRRRENHASVERRRRDHINDCIGDFVRMVPDLQACTQLNKGVVLRKATDYMQQLIHHGAFMEQQLQAAMAQWAAAGQRIETMGEHLRAANARIDELALQNETLRKIIMSSPAAREAAEAAVSRGASGGADDFTDVFLNANAQNDVWNAHRSEPVSEV